MTNAHLQCVYCSQLHQANNSPDRSVICPQVEADVLTLNW